MVCGNSPKSASLKKPVFQNEPGSEKEAIYGEIIFTGFHAPRNTWNRWILRRRRGSSFGRSPPDPLFIKNFQEFSIKQGVGGYQSGAV
jgi:hypothetical protein